MTHIGLIGLGKMGGNMRTRLRNKGIEVTGYARSRDVSDVDSIADLVAALPTPRTVWVMVPHGQPTDDVINELVKHLDKGDLIIEGGNSRFSEDIRHAAELAEHGIAYLDCGRSLEATSKQLFVHANTVRYRLKRISEIIGWDATGAHEAFVLQVAMVLGSMSDSTTEG